MGWDSHYPLLQHKDTRTSDSLSLYNSSLRMFLVYMRCEAKLIQHMKDFVDDIMSTGTSTSCSLHVPPSAAAHNVPM